MQGTVGDQLFSSVDVDCSHWVAIYGSQNLMTRMLQNVFTSVGGVDCSIFTELPEILTHEKICDSMVLINSREFSRDEIVQVLDRLQDCKKSPAVAFANMEANFDIEPFLQWPIVKGGFPQDLSPYLLLKGVSAIFSGESWFSRDTLENFLDRYRNKKEYLSSVDAQKELKTLPHREPHSLVDAPEALKALTRRELEILSLVATGACNTQIASLLYLSPHTVKTHLYNLYKKLNVDNRLQAVNLAKAYVIDFVDRDGIIPHDLRS